MGIDHGVYDKPWLLFYILQTLGLLIFAAGILYKISIYRQGKKRSLFNKIDYSVMIKAFLIEVVFKQQLLRKSLYRWLAHMFIAYGFLGLIALSAIAVLFKMVPDSSSMWLYMMQGEGYDYYKMAGELFGLMMLVGTSMAIGRRYLLKDEQLYSDANDLFLVLILFSAVVTGFLLEAMRISLMEPNPAWAVSFIGYPLAELFRGVEGVATMASFFWVFHSALNAAFFAYFPFSKAMHIVNGPMEIVLNASEEKERGDLYLWKSQDQVRL